MSCILYFYIVYTHTQCTYIVGILGIFILDNAGSAWVISLPVRSMPEGKGRGGEEEEEEEEEEEGKRGKPFSVMCDRTLL